MEKRRKICFLLFLIFVILFNYFNFISAGYLGISPGIFKIHFEPNLRRTFEFKVSDSNPNEIISLYVQGDLANYSKLSKSSIVGEGSFSLTLNLPSKIEIPGNHRLIVGAKQEKASAESGIEGVIVVQAVIDVFVPYPGKYAEMNFNVYDVNEGENALYEWTINNLGTENFDAYPTLEVYNLDEKIYSISLEKQHIKTKETIKLSDFLNTSNLDSGTYNVSATLDYGKILQQNDSFRIGSFLINISDYSYEFLEKKINKFYVEVQNLWNSPIEEIYSKITVTDKGKVVQEFKTVSENLKAWEIKNLTGFLDTEGINPGKYTANINVFYDTSVTSKLVTIYVLRANSMLFYFLLAVIIVCMFLILIIIYLKKQMNSIKNEKTKNKKQKN